MKIVDMGDLKVTYAGFVGNHNVEVYINGSKILSPHKVKIVEHEPWVAQWYRTRKKKEIWVDNDVVIKKVGGRMPQEIIPKQNEVLLKQNELSLAVHEITEKWLYNTFFKDVPFDRCYSVVHPVAEKMEKNWHIAKYGKQSWDRYDRMVELAHEKENIVAGKRGTRLKLPKFMYVYDRLKKVVGKVKL